MKTFIWMVKQFGMKIALDNVVISFVKKFTGAKRIRLIYKARKGVKRKKT